MKSEIIKINLPLGLYLSQIEPFKSKGIPTNSIIHKQVPGAGITTFEISYAKHNSIIIEPNVPVIESKVKEHNYKYPEKKVLGVHKGIDIDDVKAYLLSNVEFKKIITTPEGFLAKVITAFEGIEGTLYEDFFLLYDECERIVTDVSYRGAIAAPLDEFFNFKNKALVSATTLPFSSELFREFNHYVIRPDYKYNKPLKVIGTNNVIASLGSLIDASTSEHLFIFLNSTDGINAVLKGLDIEKDSVVFCAQDSVVKLMAKKFRNASSIFDVTKLAKYNFFTSRYFSAMDMKMDFKPDVVMVSDIIFAPHSMLDPHTEVIQIAGRFRNGINSLTHIAAFNSEIEVMSRSEALSYLEGCLDLHEEIVELLSKDKKKSSLDMLEFLKEKSPVATFYTKGNRNPFMLDNALNEARVENYYKEQQLLADAYLEVTDHFAPVVFTQEEHLISDEQMRFFRSINRQKEMWREAAKIMDRFRPRLDRFVLSSQYVQAQNNRLISMFPLIYDAICLIGLDGLEETNYIRSSIDSAVRRAKKDVESKRIMKYVYEVFSPGTIEIETEMIDKLQVIAKVQNYKYKVTATLLTKFFEANRSTVHGVNVWKIGNKIE